MVVAQCGREDHALKRRVEELAHALQEVQQGWASTTEMLAEGLNRASLHWRLSPGRKFGD